MEKQSIARLLYVINLSVLVSCLFVGGLVFSLGQLLDAPPQEVPFVCGVEEPPSLNHQFPFVSTEEGLKGKALFKENCAMCHVASDQRLIGPGLWQIGKRRPLEWIVKWIHNPMKMVNSGDPYAVEIYKTYNRFPMAAFPALKEKQIKQILEYLDSGE